MPAAVKVGLIAILTQAMCFAAVAEQAQMSGAPIESKGAGAFRAIQLSKPPTIDGRAWRAVLTSRGSDSNEVRIDFGRLALVFRPIEYDTGDFERYALYVQRRGSDPVLIAGLTGWAFVTPNRRYVITEPLYVLDVEQWTRYALFDALDIPNYTSVEAISGDGRRLFISRVACALDCRDEPREYYELFLPQ